MDLQLFYRDTEQVDNWMSKQEVTTPFLRKELAQCILCSRYDVPISIVLCSLCRLSS